MLLQLDADDDEAEQKVRVKVERQAEREIAAGLENQQEKVVASAGKLDSLDDFPEWAARDLEAALTRSKDEGDLYEALRRALAQSADLGVSVAVQQFDKIGFGFDWTLANTAARDWANRYAGQLIGQINETTRGQVRQAVAAWVENGLPLRALEDELAGTFGRDRARLIAQTESTRAYAEANIESYRASGVVGEVEWRTANDGERVCPICGERHGRRAPLDNPQIDGIGIPGHPACRCWWVPVTS